MGPNDPGCIFFQPDSELILAKEAQPDSIFDPNDLHAELLPDIALKAAQEEDLAKASSLPALQAAPVRADAPLQQLPALLLHAGPPLPPAGLLHRPAKLQRLLADDPVSLGILPAHTNKQRG